MDDPNLNRKFYLPRLPREYYQADAVVHWTMSMDRRAKGWLNPSFHSVFRELLLHAAAREGLLCPVYCLMLEHIHFVWMGLRRDTDQLNALAFLRTQLAPVLAPLHLQHQAYDHVMKEEERQRNAFAQTCFYVLDNARKAGLVEKVEDWPFAGAVIPGYPVMHPLDDGFWPRFWKIYSNSRKPDAGQIKRPPIGRIGGI